MTGVVRDRDTVERGHGLVRPPQLRQHSRAPDQRFGTGAGKPESAVVACERLVEPREALQCVGARDPGAGSIRRERQRPVAQRQCLARLVELQQHPGEIGQRLGRARLQLDDALEKASGLGRRALLDLDRAENLQRFDLPRLAVQERPTERLRFGEPALVVERHELLEIGHPASPLGCKHRNPLNGSNPSAGVPLRIDLTSSAGIPGNFQASPRFSSIGAVWRTGADIMSSGFSIDDGPSGAAGDSRIPEQGQDH